MSTHTATPTAAPPPLLQEEYKSVAPHVLTPSPTNPRKHFDQAKLRELADSIRSHGVLQPILVRPNPGVGKLAGTLYEIVAGERRWRGATMADVAAVPICIRPLTDLQVDEIQLIENGQREDVHPLEEASGFQRLIDIHGYTAADIAAKLGCGETYVHKRLRLAKLIDAARKAFLAGELKLEHVTLIAPLEPQQQKEALELAYESDYDRESGKHFKCVVASALLKARIQSRILMSLDAAPWKRDDETLLKKAGACSSCTKRTGANPHLFADMQPDKGAVKDQCLDRECFEAKRRAFIDVACLTAKKENGVELVRVATDWCDHATAKKLGVQATQFSYEKVSQKKKCEGMEKAIVVHGTDTGQVITICRDSKCKTHHPHGRSSCGSQRSPQELAAERKRKLDAKIDALYRQELWARTWEFMRTDGELDPPSVQLVAYYLIERIGHDGRGPLVKVLDLKPDKAAKKANGSFGYEDTNSKMLRKYFNGLDNAAQTMFIVALAAAPALGSMHGSALKSLETLAADLGLAPASVKKEVAAPILEKAKKAAENAKKKAKAEAKAGSAKPKAKAATAPQAVEEDDYTEADPEDEANEDWTDPDDEEFDDA